MFTSVAPSGPKHQSPEPRVVGFKKRRNRESTGSTVAAVTLVLVNRCTPLPRREHHGLLTGEGRSHRAMLR